MKVDVAILGTGNIGTDLLLKILNKSSKMQVKMFAGIDPQSKGIALAKGLGVPTSTASVDAILNEPSVKIVFDATSAKQHLKHAPLFKEAGMIAVDLTPAAVGRKVVPAVDDNPNAYDVPNINLITCGAQGTIPMMYAVSRVAEVRYGETITTLPSKSAGPGTRANIDEFTVTTADGIKTIGKAKKSKSIIILNPAEPPIVNQHTIYAILEKAVDQKDILESVNDMVNNVQRYVPGYRLKHKPVFFDNQVTIMIEIVGAGDFLPQYAGNLDIITSAALAVGEAVAKNIFAIA